MDGPLCGLLAPPEAVKAGQTQSNHVKPNQNCWVVRPPPPYIGGYARRCCGCATFASYRGSALDLAGIKANQTKSNQIKLAERLACPEIGHSGARGRRNAAWSSPIKPGQTQSNCGKVSNPLLASAKNQEQRNVPFWEWRKYKSEERT